MNLPIWVAWLGIAYLGGSAAAFYIALGWCRSRANAERQHERALKEAARHYKRRRKVG